MQNILQKNTRFNQFRFIPRFEIKGKNLIKGMRMEGLKKLDKFFYRIQNVVNQGADEIIIDDIVASLYSREIDINFLKEISNFINIPITYSGGVSDLKDIDNLLKNGADKVSLNTITYSDTNFVKNAIKNYGSQCINCTIQTKKINEQYFCFYLSGREWSNVTLNEKLKEVINLEFGEIFIYSIDYDGLEKGIDADLFDSINTQINIPFLYGGGVSNINDVNLLIKNDFRGVVISSSFHYNNFDINKIKSIIKI